MRLATKRTETENLFETLANKSPVGVYIVQDGKFCYTNPAFQSTTGYREDELLGRDALGLVVPEDRERVRENAIKMLKGKLTLPYQFRVIHKTGSIRWIIESVSSIQYRGRRATLGNFLDITDRKQAEDALRESREKFQKMFESVTDGIAVIDLKGVIIETNPGTAEMHGFASKDELLGRNAIELVAPRDHKRITENMRKAVKEGTIRGVEYTLLKADGTEFPAELSTSVVRDASGKVVAHITVARDITERKKAQEALQAEKNKLQTLIDTMEDHITIRDRDYNLIYMAEQVKKLWGDHTGEKCYRVLEGQDKVCDGCPVEEAFKDGKSHTSERRTVLPSGEIAFWETRANPIRDAEGRIVSCLEIARNITERKKAEEAINLQRAYFQQLFDNSPDAIVMIDTNDRVIRVNRAFEVLFGYSNEEVKGRSLIEFVVPEEDVQEVSDSLPRILGGEVVRKEGVRRRKDGSLVNVSILTYPIRSNGKLVGAYVIYTDITARKRAEQALADELARRRLLVEHSLDGIVVIDENDKVYEANQRFAEMLGYTMEEVRELHTWDWDKNFSPEQIHELGRKADEKGFHLETKHTRKDGSVIDVDISISAITYRGQKLIFCICRDVTERNKMAEALKLAAEEWRNTFDSISDAISIHDREFRILRANKAFADIFSMEPHQIIGKHCYELHKGEKPKPGCPHKQTLATGKPAMAEFYESHLRKYLLESTSPIFDDKGEVVGTVHITRDITEQKQQNERLLMADRLASIGELAAGTAHELNNPLTSIIGFSQLLMEKDIPDDIREDVKLIYDEAQRAANVTKNLLTFARKHPPVKQLTQINNVIEDVLKLRAYEQKVNSIEVKKRLDPDLPEIMVDYFQMQQVFLNIIINAEYFMIEAHKKGTLTITTKKQKNNVMISIADDGPGIPPENLNRIFDPFFTTKEAGKGTGLGLSICHGIVTEHGGQIYAKSQPGKGATIFIELPINGSDHIESML